MNKGKIKSANNNNNINIAEILKDCPKRMKLFSSIYGEVKFCRIDNNGLNFPIVVETVTGGAGCFSKEGRINYSYPEAECVLFPSSKMRNWKKFFKRGDVVYIKEANYVTDYAIFESWENDDYTEFNASIFYNNKSGFAERKVCTAKLYTKANDILKAKLITFIEQHYNGKYNPDTLQVEPVKPECPFKPFDKVLVRDEEEDLWYANFFAHYNEDDKYYPYSCIGTHYRYCIPYNEHTAHLLGTTDPYTEGEGGSE